MKEKQVAVPVKLTPQTIEEIDKLVSVGVFASRSEAIKFGIRMMILIEKIDLPISRIAEEYAYGEIKEKFARIRDVHRSRPAIRVP